MASPARGRWDRPGRPRDGDGADDGPGWAFRAGSDPERGPGAADLEVVIGPPSGEPPRGAGERLLLVVAAVGATAAVLAAAIGAAGLLRDPAADVQVQRAARAELRSAYVDYLDATGALLDELALVDHCTAGAPGDGQVQRVLLRHEAQRAADARLSLLAAEAVTERAEEVRAGVAEQVEHLRTRARPAGAAPDAACRDETAGRRLGVWNVRQQLARVQAEMRTDLARG